MSQVEEPNAISVDDVLQQISQDDEDEWEYEYSTTETEVRSIIYLRPTLDIG